MTKKQLKYEEAMSRIEQIVEMLETQSLDIDSLTEKVKEATMLIEFCREKLHNTDKSLDNILNTNK